MLDKEKLIARLDWLISYYEDYPEESIYTVLRYEILQGNFDISEEPSDAG